MGELGIIFEDLENMTEKLKLLKDKNIRVQETVDKRESRIVIFSEAERQKRSARIKEYWKKN